jgi:2-methylcitrate dehydratase PrpD
MATASRDPAHCSVSRAMAARLTARHGAGISAEDIAKAKLCLADFLACALESRSLPWCREAIAIACRAESNAAARTIVGVATPVTMPDAAFANAVLGHGLVRDDMHLGAVSHLSVTVVPIVLALAEKTNSSGAELLEAIVAGYEAGGKLGRAVLDVEVSRIFRPTGIVGPFAAAAAGARLLGLEEEAFANALSLAANTCAGFNEWAATGGSEMFFQPGFAARSALTSIELARAGAFASPSAIEGPAGLLAAYGKAGAPVALPFDDARSEIQAVFFKEVPACNFAQSPAQAARGLRLEHELDPGKIRRVVASVSYAAANYPGCDAAGPFARILQAKMSIQYNVAAALCTGHFDEQNYDPGRHADIAALARRVSLEIDDELTRAFPARQGAVVRVETTEGSRLTHRVDDVAPASNELVGRRLAAAAAACLGEARRDALVQALAGLEQSPDVSALFDQLRPEASSPLGEP